MRYLLTLVFLLAACALSWGQENIVNKKAWIEHMEKALPPAFCAEQQYFMQCFSVSRQECLDVAAAATRQCLIQKKDDIPEVLVQPRDGSHWGGIVGECAGDAYARRLLNKKIDNAKCNDANNWI